jgi:hypothetical protein
MDLDLVGDSDRPKSSSSRGRDRDRYDDFHQLFSMLLSAPASPHPSHVLPPAAHDGSSADLDTDPDPDVDRSTIPSSQAGARRPETATTNTVDADTSHQHPQPTVTITDSESLVSVSLSTLRSPLPCWFANIENDWNKQHCSHSHLDLRRHEGGDARQSNTRTEKHDPHPLDVYHTAVIACSVQSLPQEA